MTDSPAIPLARWAGRQLQQLADMTGSARIMGLTGQGLLAERAAANGFSVPGAASAGGACRLYRAADGWVALNLARPDDRDMLPALFGDASLNPDDEAQIAARIAAASTACLVEQGRALGMALAAGEEQPQSPAVAELLRGARRKTPPGGPPLVIDLSALWAGPLAAHLLWLAGADVVKVESLSRPDAMRDGDPGLFALLNQGKDSVQIDLAETNGRAALLSLLRRADIVIEAARPRALRQLGIDADAIVRAKPGLAWITVTGHGAEGEAAEWIGFGDDCGVAGGLSAALAEASDNWGFVGDAIADPLTGIVAAREAWRAWQSGISGRIGLSMSVIAAQALAEERSANAQLLTSELRGWAAAIGQPIASGPFRSPRAALRPLGADSARWLAAARC